ncbi:MAG: tetratricopeptide repeat protein [Acidobacteriia bacterium]|nr:tetratricopeptide repeat protein [Terriglobia bacterium]
MGLLRNSQELKIYNLSYAHRRLTWAACWLVAVSTLACATALLVLRLSPAMTGRHPVLAHRLVPMLGVLGVASLMAVFVLWAYSGWYSVHFRYVAWWIARTLGTLRRWALTGWRAALILCSGVMVLRWVHWWRTSKPPHPFLELLDAGSVVRTLAWSGLLVVVWWAYQARKRIVILSFANCTGDDTLKATVEGIAPRLLNELCRLTELYSVTDEARPGARQAKEAGLPGINVQDVGEALEGVVSADSKMKLGANVEIPVGALVATVGRIVQGPRLSGSLHKEGNSLVLIARIVGGERSGSWRINYGDLDDGEATGSATAIRMVEQLAYRVFTHVVRTGSPRWRAVRCYSEGLRIYRDQLRSSKDRKLRLYKAEKAFIQALAEDSEFARNYYNLGIVYRDLQIPESARTAFRSATERDPGFSAAYYALAFEAQKSNRLEDATRLCEQVLFLQPKDAQAWRLKGLAERESGREATQFQRSHEIAAALAWRALCRSAWTGWQGDVMGVARDCLTELAEVRADLHDSSAAAVFGQGLYLDPTFAYLHFRFGRFLMDRGKYGPAVQSFRRALRTQDRFQGWAYLAKVQADLFRKSGKAADRSAALDACKSAMNCPSGASEQTLDLVEQVYTQIGLHPIPERPDVVIAIRSGRACPRNLRRWDWARAFVEMKHGHRYLRRNKPARAAECFRNAIQDLRQRYPNEIQATELYSSLTTAYQRDGRMDEALQSAKEAVKLAPDSVTVRSLLGDVYYELHDYEHAESEWQTSLDLDPNQPVVLRKIADSYISRGVNILRIEARRQAFSRVIRLLGQALEISDRTLDLAWLHFWLGRFHNELLEFDPAIQHFNMAKSMGCKPAETRIYLGWTYLGARAYTDAEATFGEASAEVKKLLKAGQSGKKPTSIIADDMPTNDLLSQVYLGRAWSYAERGANLQQAQDLVRRATWPISQLDVLRQPIFTGTQHHCLGLVRLREGATLEAVQELETAVKMQPSFCCSYFRLAQAYLARADSDLPGRAQLLTKARERCLDARQADLREEHKEDIAALLRQLDALQALPAAKAA